MFEMQLFLFLNNIFKILRTNLALYKVTFYRQYVGISINSWLMVNLAYIIFDMGNNDLSMASFKLPSWSHENRLSQSNF